MVPQQVFTNMAISFHRCSWRPSVAASLQTSWKECLRYTYLWISL